MKKKKYEINLGDIEVGDKVLVHHVDAYPYLVIVTDDMLTNWYDDDWYEDSQFFKEVKKCLKKK